MFITGGDGLLGSNLSRELLKRGHDLLVLVQPGRKAKTLDGLNIEFDQTNNGSVTGYSYAIGLTPEIHYAKPQLSASYKYYFKSYKSNLQAGLILNNTRVCESGENENSSKDSKMSGGFLIGYAGSLVEKEVFFMRFQAQFRYIFPLEVTTSDSYINGEKIGLSHLFVGIQTGIKTLSSKK